MLHFGRNWEKLITNIKCALFIAVQNCKLGDERKNIWHIARSQRPVVRTSGRVVPEILPVPLAPETTAGTARLVVRYSDEKQSAQPSTMVSLMVFWIEQKAHEATSQLPLESIFVPLSHSVIYFNSSENRDLDVRLYIA